MTTSVNLNELTALQKAAILLQQSQARIAKLEQLNREPIAVVGMGCRFPGGQDPESFWKLLEEGKDAISEVPTSRWNLDTYFDPNPAAPGKMYSKWGGFLEDIYCFDANFFGISPREAQWVDPQHRLLLEVAWEALEDAAIPPTTLAGSRTGVFVGVIGFDYGLLQMRNLDCLDVFSGTGASHSILANRLSYFLDVHGPSMIIDTACSSSLVAIHQACQSLRRGDVDLVLAGGVNVMLAPEVTVILCKAQMLSPYGRCRAFDAAADGYVRGEGCGIVVLKRLSDARRDGDRILAVIKGSGINHGGHSNGLSAPNGDAQQAVLRAALADAGIEPGKVDYLEAHGTGTRLGDPVEFDAIMAVYGQREGLDPLILGSVKTNIGHLEGAAGIAGVIKALLMIRHQAIPAHLHLSKPNPLLRIDQFPVRIPSSLEHWMQRDTPFVTAISSFGFGGANAHLILEEQPDILTDELVSATLPRPWHILTMSARSTVALTSLISNYCRFLITSHDSLEDIAYTANIGRNAFSHRLSVWGRDIQEIVQQLADREGRKIVRGAGKVLECPRIAFLFTGQGAQYAGMGMGLYETHPIFRAALDRCDAILRPLLGHSVVSLLVSEDDELLSQTGFTQPVLFSIEYALSELWRSWGVVPAAVMGHSVGEFCAAVVAGVMSLEDAAALITRRATLMQALPMGGRMAAVMADEHWVRQCLENQPGIAIAAINGPKNIVISGTDEAVGNFVRLFSGEGVVVKELRTSHAFHSHLIDPVLGPLTAFAQDIKPKSPQLPLISNMSGQVADGSTFADSTYWARHAREPVRFAEGCETLQKLGCNVFVEIGPQPILVNMARQCVPAQETLWLPSLLRGRDDWDTLLSSLGNCFVHGIEVDWRAFDAPWFRRKVVLPSYPFQRESYVVNPDANRTMQLAKTDEQGHPVLGGRLRTPRREGLFESLLTKDSPSWLGDHLVQGQVVVPAAVMWEMALAAGLRVGLKKHSLARLQIINPIILNAPLRLQTLIQMNPAGEWSFEIFSQPWDADADATFVSHASGVLIPSGDIPIAVDSAMILAGFTGEPFDDAWRRHALGNSGFMMGPAFIWSIKHWRNETGGLGRCRMPSEHEKMGFVIPPGYLDAGLQLLGAALPDAGETHDIYLPVGCERLEVWRVPEAETWCLCQITHREGQFVKGNLIFFEDEGAVLARITNLELRQVTRGWLVRILLGSKPQWLYRLDWIHSPIPLVDSSSLPWLIVGKDAQMINAIIEELTTRGEQVEWLTSDISPQDLVEKLTEYGKKVGLILIDPEDAQDDASGRYKDENEGWNRLLKWTQAFAGLGNGLRFYLVTRGAINLGDESRPPCLGQSVLWGLGRVVASEYPDFSFFRIDLDPSRPASEVNALVNTLVADDKEDQILFRDDKRMVARLHAVPVDQGKLQLPEGPEYCLEIKERGELDSITLRSCTRRLPGPMEVELRVEATGLNFRDVLNLLNLYPGDPGQLGGECSGIVTALGEGVKGVNVGDRVMALAPASFASHLCTYAGWVASIPADMGFEDAATIPIAFLTADHALRRLAKLQSGQRVLIHAASGGLGLAAIQIAQRVGAVVYATAGNPRKRAFLRTLGVAEVMDSRSLGFADRIKELTNGAGVHAVLNSLTGEAIAIGLKILAPGGHFLEVGKTDLWDQQRVDALHPGIHFHAIALDDMMREHPHEVGARLQALSREFDQGQMEPLTRQVYDIRHLPDALRTMSRAEHIGKLVIRAATGEGEHKAIFHSHACYLVTGGLGGLGLELTRWLADRGAKCIVLVGRSTPSQGALRIIGELRSRGIKVDCHRCDIADPEHCAALLAKINQEHIPLRGIFHLAGILDDGLLRDQTPARIAAVLAPKCWGAWNLHALTRNMRLDHFVLFSSVASIFGSPGQGNYAAANAYLDALAHYRRWWNLPAMSINWGPWGKVGMAARMGEGDERRRLEAGIQSIEPALGFWMLERLIWRNSTSMVAAQINWYTFSRRLPADLAPPWMDDLIKEYQNDMDHDSSEASAWRQRVEECPNADRLDLLISLLQQKAVHVLGHSGGILPDTDRPLNELGFDSLTGVEFCNAVGRALMLQINPMLLFEYSTLKALAEYILRELHAIDGNMLLPISKKDDDSFTEEPIMNEVLTMSEMEMEQLVEEQLNRLGNK